MNFGKFTVKECVKIGIFLIGLIFFAMCAVNADYSFINYRADADDFPVGAIAVLMLFWGFKDLLMWFFSFSAGYRVGRYFQKRNDKK